MERERVKERGEGDERGREGAKQSSREARLLLKRHVRREPQEACSPGRRVGC
jgi:hypothetical protein